jgi:hypothetical protein
MHGLGHCKVQNLAALDVRGMSRQLTPTDYGRRARSIAHAKAVLGLCCIQTTECLSHGQHRHHWNSMAADLGARLRQVTTSHAC